MAHMIDMSNKRANIAYVGEKPWHGLGYELRPGAPIEEWRVAAGLDWQIESTAVEFSYPTDDGLATGQLDDRRVLFRSDTKAPLSIVSDRYKVVQPGEVLEFYRDLVDCGDFELETAGVLHGGKKMWALAKTGDSVRLRGTDVVNGYLLLATSCDGSMQTTAKLTSIRVVCQNTLTASLGTVGAGLVRVPHSTQFDRDKVKRELGIVHETWVGFQDAIEALAGRKITQDEAVGIMVATFGDVEKKPDEQSTATLNLMRAAWESMLHSPGAQLPAAKATAWGAVSGVTYLIDHVRKAQSVDNRLNSAWFGPGEELKRRAFEAALRLVA